MRTRLFTLLLLASGAAALAVEPLACPQGTISQKETDQARGRRSEFCKDTRTGKLHGPARELDAAGAEVLLEATFESGERKSARFTLAGLRTLIAQVNANAAKAGQQWSMRVVDEHRIEQTSTLLDAPDGTARTADAKRMAELREMVVANPQVCRIFSIAGTDIRTVVARFVDSRGGLVGETVIERGDCAGAR